MKRAWCPTLAVLSVLCLTGLLAGCPGSSGECGPNEDPGVTISVTGSDVEANGTDSFRVTINGKDENCDRLPSGTEIRLTLAGADPDGVGYFHATDGSQPTTLEVNLSSIGATAQVESLVAGTVTLRAQALDYEELDDAIVTLEFIEPQATGQCAVQVSADPPSILADGISISDITAQLTGDSGAPMPDGTAVTFTTNLGTFTGSGSQYFTASSIAGAATARLRSEELDEDQQASVTASFTCNDVASTIESGNQTVRMLLNMDEPQVVLTASRTSILADGTQTVDLTAEVFLPDGLRAGAGEDVDFLVTGPVGIGTFQESASTAYTGTTDAGGIAYATFRGGTVGGLADVSASVYIGGQTASHAVQISLRQIGYVEFVDADPIRLGLHGSGRQETSVVTFRVLDTARQPMAGIQVDFFLEPETPYATLDPTTWFTNDFGLVDTTLIAGTTPVSVAVRASATVGTQPLTGVSPALAIVGAKPSAAGMGVACEYLNVGAWRLLNYEMECTVLLEDRNDHKVGLATSVVPMVEAGQVDPNATTIEEGPAQGSAVINWRTSAGDLPVDVAPLTGEPFVVEGAYVRNPRDGLVHFVVYTSGEEEFSDENGNGEWNTGEPFVDLGEPFVDANDDGIYGPGDNFHDSNGNTTYDPPNGQFDTDAAIWTATWFVMTDRVKVDPDPNACLNPYRQSAICGSDLGGPFVICPTEDDTFYYSFVDFNLNPINSSAHYNSDVGDQLEASIENPEFPFDQIDDLGTGIGYLMVNNIGTMAPCLVTDDVCYRFPRVSGFSGAGWTGLVVVVGDVEVTVVPSFVRIDADFKDAPGTQDSYTSSLYATGVSGPDASCMK